MAYVTYEFYTEQYGGEMSQADFCRYVGRSAYVLEEMTSGRVKNLYPQPPQDVAKAVGMAISAIMDGMAKMEKASGRTVILESVGKHRVAYASTVQNAAAQLRREVAPYLRGVKDAFGVPLTFRGVAKKTGASPEGGCA